MNAFAAIEQAVQTLMQQSPAVSTRIDLGVPRSLPKQSDTGMGIRMMSVSVESAAIHGGPLWAESELRIELRRLGPSGESAAVALDAPLTAAQGRLTDATLGGLVSDMALTGIEFDTDAQGEAPAHTATLTYTVRHQINRTTLA